jgi:hypothetical protein
MSDITPEEMERYEAARRIDRALNTPILASQEIRALSARIEQLVATNEELEAKLAEVVEALRKLHHSVCGETGFASCVRIDSGKAYPWPALDEADELARTTLAELKGENQ